MDKFFTVSIYEIDGSDFSPIGKKKPLRTLAEVHDFLVQYTTTWGQSPPPPVQEIEHELEAQRAAMQAKNRLLPGTRLCEFTLKPYVGSDIVHLITVMEMSGTFSEMGQQAVLLQDVGPALIRERTCRVCGCTDSDCRHCKTLTGAPCHWVGPHLCSACTPQETLMAQTQWTLDFSQARVIEAVCTAHNHWDHRRHDERFHLRVVHRNERDHFVYVTIAKGELVGDDTLFELGWKAHELALKGGPAHA